MMLALMLQVILDQPGNLNTDDLTGLINIVVGALKDGQWPAAIAPIVLLIIAVLRKYAIPTFGGRFPLLLDKRFTLALTIAVPVLGTIASALIAGAPISIGLVVSAVLSGLAAIGLYSGQKNWKEGSLAAKPPSGTALSAVIGGPLK